MKDLLLWWFSPKKRFSPIIKILIGAFIVFAFGSSVIGNSIDLIDAFRHPPLFIGVSHLVLPIVSSFIVSSTLYAGLFYLPYCILGSKKRYSIRILLAVLTIGTVLSVAALGEYIAPYYPTFEAKELTAAEAKLGTIQASGDYYTLREFGYDIARLTKFPPDYTIPIPDYMITEGAGYPELVIFYKESEALWAEYEQLTNKPTSVRREYRSNHPEVEARLLFWGKYSFKDSVFTQGSPEAEEIISLILMWFDQYDIDRRMHPAFTN